MADSPRVKGAYSAQPYNLIPAFTFSSCKTGVFHRDLPSEVGQLADVALELREFSRSNHGLFFHLQSVDQEQMRL